jgi:hypothetical protein
LDRRVLSGYKAPALRDRRAIKGIRVTKGILDLLVLKVQALRDPRGIRVM